MRFLLAALGLVTGAAAVEPATVLRAAFQHEESWVKIHAAEALWAGGYGTEMHQACAALLPRIDRLVYRVGVYRVLAESTPDPAERERCIAAVAKIFLTPDAPDRSQAIETLCKLRVAPQGALEAEIRRVARQPQVLFQPLCLWSLAVNGDEDALAQLEALLRSPAEQRRLVSAYALRWLGTADPAALQAVARAADTEPAGTAAYPYALSAALALHAERAQPQRREHWRQQLEQLLQNGTTDAKFEACQGLKDQATPQELPRFERLLADPAADARIGGAAIILAVERRAVTNFDPTPAHPRSSEGSFATFPSGRIIYCYSQFNGGGRDDSPSAIAQIESTDQGRTWSAPRVIVPPGHDRNVMSVSLLALRDGRLAMYYLAKHSGWLSCQPYQRFSPDEGRTWGEPAQVSSAPGYFEMNNDRAVQLRSGRILLPLSLYRIKGTVDSSQSWDSRALQLWLYSDDAGQTWHESDTWWTMPVVSRSGLQEPGVVELGDGSIFSWARTDAGCQYEARSTDGGSTWSPPVPGMLRSPESPASIKRRPHSDDLIALYNDHSGRFTYPFPAARTPLVVAVSHDGGRSWPARKVLEEDPTGWYCYTAIATLPDSLLLAYCASDGTMPKLSRLRIRRVAWEWLPN